VDSQRVRHHRQIYLPVFTGLGLFLLVMLAACAAEGEVDALKAQGSGETVTLGAPAQIEVFASPLATVNAADTAPPATDTPLPTTISTELSECVTLLAWLATRHNHGSGGSTPKLPSPPYQSLVPVELLSFYCGSYVDAQLFEQFDSHDYGVPTVGPVRFGDPTVGPFNRSK
jgi:hypothetical protein